MDEEDNDTTGADTTTEPEHVCDHSACEAKVSTLNDALADKDAELTIVKAANYDLLIGGPGDDVEPEIEISDDAADGDIDTFFV